MKAVVNDLSFQYQFYSQTEAKNKLEAFIKLCRIMKSGKLKKVENVYLGERIDVSFEIAPHTNIMAMLGQILPTEERGFLLAILTNSAILERNSSEPFEYNGGCSYSCADARNEILLSLMSDECFDKDRLEGKIGEQDVSIKNVAKEEHTIIHGSELGKRIYKANDKKHKKDSFNYYGGGIASPMDLDGEEAQELLDSAIEFKGRLYARRGNNNYSFQNEQSIYYHGYIDDKLGDDVIRELDKKQWK